ncbi:MAG: hypothetical protein EZS28_035264 [Streblomastix strix]|uniref:Uncharacterized protein n=1 Tax=Streblomastix strix TaxID=222440 RepID=A0A5J4UEZ4_9EUKA|nr:MAG: hypothetical protein EZS28_035264 [Streblomastix strix]
MNASLSQQQIRTVRQLITNDIAYYIQYQKRGNSSGGMMSNEEYQLFIDNNNALVYAANNQIVDGMASDYALKIEPNGLLTIKNLKVINFDFVAQINQLINQVNLLQQSIGTTEQDITDIKNDIDTINQELSRQTHFRGYYLLNTDIQNLPNSANGDFSFSAESGTVWMYDADWYNSGDIVPDQVTPASDATPLSDGTVAAGYSTEYSRGDHVHPLNVTTTIPISDSASGSVGTTNYYARNDHSHPLNITTTIPPQDSTSGSVGTTNYYARNDHSHPINVETNASNIPIVNGVGANGSSAFYARQDHVHPQQLTYDGNVTATKFIKTGGLTSEVLCANGDTKVISDIVSNYVDLTTNQTITGVKTFDSFKKTNGTNQQILLADGTTKPIIYATRSDLITTPKKYIKLCTLNPQLQENCISVEFQVRGRSGFGLLQFHQRSSNTSGLIDCGYHFQPNYQDCMQEAYALYFGTGTTRTCQLWVQMSIWSNQVVIDYTNRGTIASLITDILTSSPVNDLPTDYTSMITLTPNLQFNDKTINNAPFTQNGNMQINPTGGEWSDGLRIARCIDNDGGCSIVLGCDRTQTSGSTDHQWQFYTPKSTSNFPFGLVIALSNDVSTTNRGLRISADGNTLSFNGSIIAGTGATNGSANGSVNYSAGNPILWGVNSDGNEGGFFSSGANICWRAHPLTQGAVPP